jgi:hypothetical protein
MTREIHDRFTTLTSPWQRKQISYSKVALATCPPERPTPGINPSMGEALGALAVPSNMEWGSWQLEQVEWVGMGLAGSTGLAVSWGLTLARSVAMSAARCTVPS